LTCCWCYAQIIAKGVRQAFAASMMKDDVLWVGDVGEQLADHVFRFSAK
jgi:hypothetical protein